MALALASGAAYAQDDVLKAAQDAAAAFDQAPEQKEEPKKPKYWTNSLTTQLNIGQTSLNNWAAGGDNSFTLKGYADGSCNWAKDKMFWNNRLQLEYGMLYASSKPLFQKTNDRFYFESKWGHRIMDQLYASANFDFKSQFSKGYDYKTPSVPDSYKKEDGSLPKLDELSRSDQRKLWESARVAKSGFLSPAYTTLALGLDWTPKDWVSVSIAPLTGGFTVVLDEQFRKAYGMKLSEDTQDLQRQLEGYDDSKYSEDATEEQKEKHEAYVRLLSSLADGSAYDAVLFQLGAQIKVDFKVNINDNFKYTSQVVLFSDYLNKMSVRFNWDNKFDWQIAKYFALTLTTNMIYDNNVLKDDGSKRGLQFAESVSIGFTYTLASKSK